MSNVNIKVMMLLSITYLCWNLINPTLIGTYKAFRNLLLLYLYIYHDIHFLQNCGIKIWAYNITWDIHCPKSETLSWKLMSFSLVYSHWVVNGNWALKLANNRVFILLSMMSVYRTVEHCTQFVHHWISQFKSQFKPIVFQPGLFWPSLILINLFLCLDVYGLIVIFIVGASFNGWFPRGVGRGRAAGVDVRGRRAPRLRVVPQGSERRRPKGAQVCWWARQT